MPRYFFHVRDGDDLIRDEEGTELPDPQAAKAEAMASARDLAMDEIRSKNRVGGRKIEIVGEFGETIQTLPVRASID
jgi:hypothetical protein